MAIENFLKQSEMYNSLCERGYGYPTDGCDGRGLELTDMTLHDYDYILSVNMDIEKVKVIRDQVNRCGNGNVKLVVLTEI